MASEIAKRSQLERRAEKVLTICDLPEIFEQSFVKAAKSGNHYFHRR